MAPHSVVPEEEEQKDGAWAEGSIAIGETHWREEVEGKTLDLRVEEVGEAEAVELAVLTEAEVARLLTDVKTRWAEVELLLRQPPSDLHRLSVVFHAASR